MKLSLRLLSIPPSPLLAYSCGAALADLLLLAGIRWFLGFLGKGKLSEVALWLGAMLGLTLLRFALLRLRATAFETAQARKEQLYFLLSLRSLRWTSGPQWHDKAPAQWADQILEWSKACARGNEARQMAWVAVVQLLFFLPVLLWLSWPLTLLLFCLLGPALAWVQKKVHRLGSVLEQDLADRSQLSSTAKDWALLCRSFVGKGLQGIQSRLAHSAQRHAQAQRNMAQQKSTVVYGAEAFSLMATVLVFATAGALASQGLVDGHQLVLYCAALFLSYKPSRELGRVLPALREAKVANEHWSRWRVSQNNNTHKMHNESFISIRNLCFRYAQNAPVFTNLSLQIPLPGPLFLQGANGAGKTTLLRILAGLEVPEQGCILWPQKLFQRGVVLLNSDCIYPDRNGPFSLSPSLQAILQPKPSPQCAGVLGGASLSAGQRQRLGLALASSSHPGVLLLDEPATALPPSVRQEFLRQLVAECLAQQTLLIVVSHEPPPADLASPPLVMELS